MHALERFALGTGVKIKKPQIYQDYFPVTEDKYITFSPHGLESNNYKYWDEVLELISDKLKEKNISILQFGVKEKLIKGCKHIDMPTYSQAAFVISKSLLHVGVDSCFIHFANSLNKKIVGLYSHVLASHKGPFWKDNENHIILEPERADGSKPSFSATEKSPKAIDSIEPEEVAAAICKLLNIDFNYEYSTKCCGRDYHMNFVDIVPNVPIETYKNLLAGGFRIRMDLHFDEQIFDNYLNFASQVEVITNKPINFNLLNKHKDKIKSIIFKYDEDTPELSGWIERTPVLKTNFAFVSFLPEEKQNEFKFKYMDFALLQSLENNTKETFGLETTDNLYYKSNKIILSNGKFYPSIYCLKRDMPVNGPVKEVLPVVDEPDFWKDSDDFIILKKEVD